MRLGTLASIVSGLLALGACGTRELRHGSTSPRHYTDHADPADPANRKADAIRVTTAPRIREASAASAAAIADLPTAHPAVRANLRAPHRSSAPPALPRVQDDLRSLVGIRDKRTSLLLAIEWAQSLGLPLEGFAGTAGEDLVAWAEASDRLFDATEQTRPGDLLVFDAATSDDAADLVAIVIARDDRGVTEMLYLGGGVIRRGFVDVSRKRTRRDDDQRIVNTFLRHGRRWPAKGSRYLAGELLAHVIHLR